RVQRTAPPPAGNCRSPLGGAAYNTTMSGLPALPGGPPDQDRAGGPSALGNPVRAPLPMPSAHRHGGTDGSRGNDPLFPARAASEGRATMRRPPPRPNAGPPLDEPLAPALAAGRALPWDDAHPADPFTDEEEAHDAEEPRAHAEDAGEDSHGPDDALG